MVKLDVSGIRGARFLGCGHRDLVVSLLKLVGEPILRARDLVVSLLSRWSLEARGRSYVPRWSNYSGSTTATGGPRSKSCIT